MSACEFISDCGPYEHQALAIQVNQNLAQFNLQLDLQEIVDTHCHGDDHIDRLHCPVYQSNHTAKNCFLPEKQPKTIIPLPEFFNRLISFQPQLTELLAENAALDPNTFIHSVMGAELFLDLALNYSLKHKLSLPQYHYLQSHLTGFILHDIGKSAIDPNPFTAAKIINSAPQVLKPEPLIPQVKSPLTSQQEQQDHLCIFNQALHHLHPLVGGDLVAFYSRAFNLPPNTSLIAYTHHEHFTPHSQSYPRQVIRNFHPLDKIAVSLAQIADHLIASGQPRPFRPHRLSDNQIVKTLQTKILTPQTMALAYQLNYKQISPVRDFLIKTGMNKLHRLQQQFSQTVFNQPPDFQTKGQSLIQPHHRHGHLLSSLNRRLWQTNGPRYFQMIESSLDA